MEGLLFIAMITIIVMIAIMIGKTNSLHRKLELYNNIFIAKLNILDQLVRGSETKPSQSNKVDKLVKTVSQAETPAHTSHAVVAKNNFQVESKEIPVSKLEPVICPMANKSDTPDKIPTKPMPSPVSNAGSKSTHIHSPTAKPANALLESFFNSVREIGWEQWLGTRGVLLAGIITTLIGGGFFAKYASEHGMLGPVGRACLIAGAGLLAIIIGELTRRKDYGIVARGLTALGFALLYCSTFASYQLYDIIGSKVAFTLSILITIAAMSYSVSLNERLSAFVALLGGYLSPAMLSSGNNSYNELFSYLTVLSAGAMICANYRKWRAVNWLAYIGTAICYCGWATKYDIWSMWNAPDQKLLIAASIWAGVFFVIFLVLPVLYELRTTKLTKREDIALILSNGIYSLFIFGGLLSDHRKPLAIVVLCMASAHLILMLIINSRNTKDTPLQAVLFALTIFFTTVSLPIFFDAYALTIAWAAEGVILAIIGYQYKSKISEFGSVAAFVLVLPIILYKSAYHPQEFTLVFNQHFISLVCSAACFLIAQYLYRRFKEKVWVPQNILLNIYYFIGISTILALCANHWHWHCNVHLTTINGKPDYMALGVIPMILLYALAACSKPLRPATNKWLFVSSIACAAAAAYAVTSVENFYYDKFHIFFNMPYAIIAIAVLMIFAVSYIVSRQNKAKQDRQHYYVTAFIAIGLIWFITTMQIRSFWKWQPANPELNSRFMATMCISVFWAIYAAILITIGFWKKLPALRYTALGLFTLTLGKVFIYDMSHLANIYRIAGFVVLGVLMVSVSFLYQYARKNGIIGPLPPTSHIAGKTGKNKNISCDSEL